MPLLFIATILPTESNNFSSWSPEHVDEEHPSINNAVLLHAYMPHTEYDCVSLCVLVAEYAGQVDLITVGFDVGACVGRAEGSNEGCRVGT